jgi:MoaA/NifB/PqqE/SkfB family radical SAM enzyme
MTKIIHYEPTSRCNAACPMCARNVNGDGCVVPLQDLSLELFKTQVSACLDTLEKVFFCGAVGDPCADKTLLDKISWIKQQRKDIVVGINTNGSIRNPSWWTDCGNLLNGIYEYVVFSIDGLEDTNHIYRVGVQYKKIIENAKAYIDTGASAHWDMLVFDHNKHQIEQCKQLADNMGFTWFRSKETDRWDQFDLEQIKPANYPNEIDYHGIEDIQCERNIEQSTYIDHRGQEFPCCHISEMYYSKTQEHDNTDILSHTPQELMTEYQNRLDNQNPFYTCKRSCGTTVGKQSQWKQEVQLR